MDQKDKETLEAILKKAADEGEAIFMLVGHKDETDIESLVHEISIMDGDGDVLGNLFIHIMLDDPRKAEIIAMALNNYVRIINDRKHEKI